jgi:hypothetical protein
MAMYGRTRSQKVGHKTHFALYSGGTWTLEVYPKNFRPLIRAFDISKPDVYSRYTKIGVCMEELNIRK